MPFAAVHESLVGTERTCRPYRVMSVVGTNAENICSQRVFRRLTHIGLLSLISLMEDGR
jgi:hypothetical protein